MTTMLPPGEEPPRHIADACPALVAHVDIEQKHDFANSAYAMQFHCAPREIVGRTVRDVVGEEHYAKVRPCLETALREKVAQRCQVDLRHGPPETVGESEVTCTPEIGEDGSVTGCTLLIVDVTERKRLEASRRQTEAITCAVLAAAFDAIITIDHRGFVAEWNSAAERIFGHSRKEAIGMEMAALIIPPRLREAHRAGMRRYLTSHGGPVIGRLVELPALRSDGSEFAVDLYITPIAVDGPPVFTGFARDATERKTAEEALKRSEGGLRLALDASGAGVWTWDRATGIITADDAYRAMYGFGSEEKVDLRTWEARLHPADRDPLKQQVEDCLRSGSKWREEFRILHPRLGKRWLAGLGRVLHDAEGHATGITGINIDVTARKTAEEALRASEAHLKAVVEGAIEGIIAIDDAAVVQSLNPSAAKLFGFLPEEVIGKNVRMLMPEPHQSAHDSYLRNYLSTGEAKIIGIGREVAGKRKDGSIFPMDLGITEVRSEGRRLFIGVIRDVTERRQAEETQRLLINELNHRVKNTLATVQAMAEQTLRKSSDPSHFVESFRGRLQALSSAHNLLARRTWGTVDLESLIREQLLIGRDRDASITLSGPAMQLNAREAVHLGLALHELGTNARKYGALKVPEGRLKVTWRLAREPGHSLEIDWVESGGPVVTPPTGHGFGTFLIERGLKHSLGGEARMVFAPTGVSCHLRLPLPATEEEGHTLDAAR